MTMDTLDLLEQRRVELQIDLDAAKSKAERNQLGQFATPTPLAVQMLEQAKRLLPDDQPMRFLDPAFGTGAFYSALLRVFPDDQIVSARGYEIDPHYGDDAKRLWLDRTLDLRIEDFTQAALPDEDARCNLILCNPPYVRHHHLPTADKKRLQVQAQSATNIALNGLSGLYVYFLFLAHAWLQPGGLAGWLIPSEFMDVNYGKAVRHYLTSEVTLLGIHRFEPEDVQFEDALVSSAVVWFRKQPPISTHQVPFSLGGSLAQPHYQQVIWVTDLKAETKWTRFPRNPVRSIDSNLPRLKDLFVIKRGIATGANEFFIVDEVRIQAYQLPPQFLIPILPSPRYLERDEIAADGAGNPLLQHPLYLIDCALAEEKIERAYPTLWRYLQLGREQGVSERYLCQQRAIWYAQDRRAASPFLCTYMGRPSVERNANPFRFILNHSTAVAPNVYLNLYPKPQLASLLEEKPDLKRRIWQALAAIPAETLIGEGRVYGGGLHKLEPKELGHLPVGKLLDEKILVQAALPERQIRLF